VLGSVGKGHTLTFGELSLRGGMKRWLLSGFSHRGVKHTHTVRGGAQEKWGKRYKSSFEASLESRRQGLRDA